MSKGKTETTWRETARTVALAGLLFVGVRTAVAEPFHVPSESMEPTLLVGDFMFASKFAYGYSNSSLPFHLDLFRGRILERAAHPAVHRDPAGRGAAFDPARQRARHARRYRGLRRA